MTVEHRNPSKTFHLVDFDESKENRAYVYDRNCEIHLNPSEYPIRRMTEHM